MHRTEGGGRRRGRGAGTHTAVQTGAHAAERADTRAARRRALRRFAAGGAAASAAVLLAGCGLVGVRTAEEAGGPLRISTQPTQGPAPEVTEPTGPDVEGLVQTRLNLGSTCPARVSLYVPDDWHGTTSGSSYYAQPLDAGFESAGVNVYCSEAFGSSPSEGVNSARSYQFSDETTEVLAERTAQVGEGYSWAYQALLGEEEIMHQGAPTMTVGAVVDYPISGKVYDVRIAYTFAADDAEAFEYATAALSHLEVEGGAVAAPEWHTDDAGAGDAADAGGAGTADAGDG